MVRLLSDRCRGIASSVCLVAFGIAVSGAAVATGEQSGMPSENTEPASEVVPNPVSFDDIEEILPARLRAADPVFEERLRLQRRLLEAVDLIEQQYVEPVDREELYDAAVRAMLSKLDPYSMYPSRAEVPMLREAVDLERVDVGIDVVRDGGSIGVSAVVFGSSAQKAGIVPGDRIEAIDGVSTQEMTLDEAAARLRGNPGSVVRLTIRSERGAIPVDVELVRERLTLEEVVGWMRMQDGTWRHRLPSMESVVYVRIARFGRGTAERLGALLRRLEAEPPGIGTVVLDLRYNPGGVLQEAVETCDLFLEKGAIVTVRNRAGDRVYEAHPSRDDFRMPMYVLVNRYSASAAEVTAACLQDHKRATIVGERTFGKGSVQRIFRLEGGRLMKLTTGTYVRPNGRNIQRRPDAAFAEPWGVDPDPGCVVRLERSTVQLLLRRWGELAAARREEDTGDALFADWIACDPQFQIVLNRLQSTQSAGADEDAR
ncbi:MAG: S41 family peptidase [Planctomycetota bacterium]|nr:MAG: S41 family peptidase [Planctomycetota bacterium]